MRKQVATKIVRALFARSGNRCAFTDCDNVLIKHDVLYVGKIAHIEAAESGGPRYNPRQTDDERRSYDNLMLLCHEHHVEIDDDVSKYNLPVLRDMKRAHEKTVGALFKVLPKIVAQVSQEITIYWNTIDRVNRYEHVLPERAIQINSKADRLTLVDSIQEQMELLKYNYGYLASSDAKLNEDVKGFLSSLGYDLKKYNGVEYYKNPFYHRHWETHCLAIENCFRRINVGLTQLQVKSLEEQMLTPSGRKAFKSRYRKAKEELMRMAKGAGLAD